MIAEKLNASGLLERFPKGDPRPLLGHFAAQWPEQQRGGLVTLDLVENGESQISIWGIYPYQDYLRAVVPAYMRQVLLMVETPNPRVEYLGPGPEDPHYRHRYRLTWEPFGMVKAPWAPSPGGSLAGP
jgi:hypothetical protein